MLISKNPLKLLLIALGLVAANTVYAQEYCTQAEKLHKALEHMKTNRIAVLDFEYKGKKGDQVGRLVAEEFMTCFLRYKKFVVVERARINEVLAEHALSQSGVLASKDVKKIGRGLQVSAFVMGSVADWNGGARFNARVVDVETMEILAAESAGIELAWENKPTGPARPNITEVDFSHDALLGYGMGFYNAPSYQTLNSYVNLMLGYRGMDIKDYFFWELAFMKSFVLDQAFKSKNDPAVTAQTSGANLTAYMAKIGLVFNVPKDSKFAFLYFGGAIGISRTGISLPEQSLQKLSYAGGSVNNASEFSWTMPYDAIVGVRFLRAEKRSIAVEYRYSGHIHLSTDTFKETNLSQHFFVLAVGWGR